MAGSALDRAFAVLELLASHPVGLPLREIAESAGIPKSAAHRLLALLGERRYVRQDARDRPLPADDQIGLAQLPVPGACGHRRYRATHTRPAGAGDWRIGPARRHRRRPPDVGRQGAGCALGIEIRPGHGNGDAARVHCLRPCVARLPHRRTCDRARRATGIPPTRRAGPQRAAHDRGRCSRACGPRANAATRWVVGDLRARHVGDGGGRAAPRRPVAWSGVISVAGPSVRLTEARMHALAPVMQAAAAELSDACKASEYFTGRQPSANTHPRTSDGDTACSLISPRSRR